MLTLFRNGFKTVQNRTRGTAAAHVFTELFSTDRQGQPPAQLPTSFTDNNLKKPPQGTNLPFRSFEQERANQASAYLKQASQALTEERGVPDGDMGTTIGVLNASKIEAQYLQGVADARAARDAGEDPVNYFVAGSGNTQADADALAQQTAGIMGGTWKGIKGGSWFDNAHQFAGTGIGNTEQTSDVAYALGRCQGGEIMTHSQGDLSTHTAVNSLKDQHPEVLSTKVTSLGSPLPDAYTNNAVRLTGENDIIQYVRKLAGLAFSQDKVENTTYVTTPRGHSSTHYVADHPNAIDSLPGQNRQDEKSR